MFFAGSDPINGCGDGSLSSSVANNENNTVLIECHLTAWVPVIPTRSSSSSSLSSPSSSLSASAFHELAEHCLPRYGEFVFVPLDLMPMLMAAGGSPSHHQHQQHPSFQLAEEGSVPFNAIFTALEAFILKSLAGKKDAKRGRQQRRQHEDHANADRKTGGDAMTEHDDDDDLSDLIFLADKGIYAHHDDSGSSAHNNTATNNPPLPSQWEYLHGCSIRIHPKTTPPIPKIGVVRRGASSKKQRRAPTQVPSLSESPAEGGLAEEGTRVGDVLGGDAEGGDGCGQKSSDHISSEETDDACGEYYIITIPPTITIEFVPLLRRFQWFHIPFSAARQDALSRGAIIVDGEGSGGGADFVRGHGVLSGNFAGSSSSCSSSNRALLLPSLREVAIVAISRVFPFVRLSGTAAEEDGDDEDHEDEEDNSYDAFVGDPYDCYDAHVNSHSSSSSRGKCRGQRRRRDCHSAVRGGQHTTPSSSPSSSSVMCPYVYQNSDGAIYCNAEAVVKQSNTISTTATPPSGNGGVSPLLLSSLEEALQRDRASLCLVQSQLVNAEQGKGGKRNGALTVGGKDVGVSSAASNTMAMMSEWVPPNVSDDAWCLITYPASSFFGEDGGGGASPVEEERLRRLRWRNDWRRRRRQMHQHWALKKRRTEGEAGALAAVVAKNAGGAFAVHDSDADYNDIAIGFDKGRGSNSNDECDEEESSRNEKDRDEGETEEDPHPLAGIPMAALRKACHIVPSGRLWRHHSVVGRGWAEIVPTHRAAVGAVIERVLGAVLRMGLGGGEGGDRAISLLLVEKAANSPSPLSSPLHPHHHHQQHPHDPFLFFSLPAEDAQTLFDCYEAQQQERGRKKTTRQCEESNMNGGGNGRFANGFEFCSSSSAVAPLTTSHHDILVSGEAGNVTSSSSSSMAFNSTEAYESATRLIAHYRPPPSIAPSATPPLTTTNGNTTAAAGGGETAQFTTTTTTTTEEQQSMMPTAQPLEKCDEDEGTVAKMSPPSVYKSNADGKSIGVSAAGASKKGKKNAKPSSSSVPVAIAAAAPSIVSSDAAATTTTIPAPKTQAQPTAPVGGMGLSAAESRRGKKNSKLADKPPAVAVAAATPMAPADAYRATAVGEDVETEMTTTTATAPSLVPLPPTPQEEHQQPLSVNSKKGGGSAGAATKKAKAVNKKAG